MKVTYHPAVQKDVSSILRHYDAISPRLGEEFWAELNAGIARIAENPLRFHPAANGLRRFNFAKFPHHFLYRVLPDRVRITVVRHDKQHPRRGLARR